MRQKNITFRRAFGMGQVNQARKLGRTSQAEFNTAFFQATPSARQMTSTINITSTSTIVIVGAGSCGKTTLCNCWEWCLAKNNSEYDVNYFRLQIVQSFKTVLREAVKQFLFDYVDSNKINKDNTANHPWLLADLKLIIESISGIPIPPTTANIIESLCNDPIFKIYLEEKYKYSDMGNCIRYFGSQIDRLKDPHMTVLRDDITHINLKTTGVVGKQVFRIDDSLVKLHEFGGQPNEINKWRQKYREANCILYLVDLSQFDELAPPTNDSKSENSLEYSMRIFKEKVIESEEIGNFGIILLFTKFDIFCEKLNNVRASGYKLKDAFSEFYQGYVANSHSNEEAADALREAFILEFKDDVEQEIHTLRVNLLDKDDTSAMLENLHRLIIDQENP